MRDESRYNAVTTGRRPDCARLLLMLQSRFAVIAGRSITAVRRSLQLPLCVQIRQDERCRVAADNVIRTEQQCPRSSAKIRRINFRSRRSTSVKVQWWSAANSVGACGRLLRVDACVPTQQRCQSVFTLRVFYGDQRRHLVTYGETMCNISTDTLIRTTRPSNENMHDDSYTEIMI